MKVMIFKNALSLKTTTAMQFMKAKKMDYFLYVYNSETKRYVISDTPHSLARNNIVSTKNFGEEFPKDLNLINDYTYKPGHSKIRYDKDLISLIESDPRAFEDVRVHELPPGTVYRIQADEDFSEHIERFNPLEWMLARE